MNRWAEPSPAPVYERVKNNRQKIAVQSEKRHGQSEVKFCRDERLASEQTTTAVTEPQASINHYKAKGCLKKQKMKKRENILLDSRQPFMNRVGFSPPIP
jgi:hypothetical protein